MDRRELSAARAQATGGDAGGTRHNEAEEDAAQEEGPFALTSARGDRVEPGPGRHKQYAMRGDRRAVDNVVHLDGRDQLLRFPVRKDVQIVIRGEVNLAVG